MLEPLKPWFAWALLGYAALEIFFTLLRWMESFPGNFSAAAAGADFTTLITVGFPLLAVILVRSRLNVAIALVEYAVILFLGSLAWLIGLYSVVWRPSGVASLLSYLVMGLAGLAFAALCGYACLRVFRSAPPAAS